MSSRHRPLHTSGVSILAIAHSAYEKAQAFNGPIGSTTRRVAKIATFATPLAYAMQYQWLAILSFADDLILAGENVVEKMFPPSTYVFNGIDNLVQIIGTFPEKFDDAFDKAPEIVHRVCLDCANFLITTLTQWGSGSTREREIVVDINSKELEEVSKTVDSGTMKGTYKEVLQKGTNENNVEKKSRDEKVEKMEKNTDKTNKDPIIELFESACP